MAVSPINGLSRVATGKAWKDGPAHKPVPLLADFRLGIDGLGLSEGTGWGTGVRASIRLDYGDAYAKPSLTVPFEVFDFAIQITGSNEFWGQGFDGSGVLMGEQLGEGGVNDNLLAWVLSYEYSTNASEKTFERDAEGTYQLGLIGTGPSWYGRWRLANDVVIDSKLAVLAVPTGVVTSPYAVYEVNRCYNFDAGGALKAEVNLRQKRLGRVYAEYDRYLYHVMNGSDGVDHVGMFKVGAYGNVYKGHGLGAAAIHYDRNSYYDDYADVDDSFWSAQAHYEYEW